MAVQEISVHAVWDPEAEVYVATSEDVPGLATEAASIPELAEKLAVMVPELLEINGADGPGASREVPMSLVAQHTLKVRVPT